MKHSLVHEPAAQTRPEPQPVPSALLVVVQAPVPSQVEVAWQAVAVQVYEVPPQTPAVQTSVLVQATPSLQLVLFALLVVVQPPAPSHVEVAWHWVGVQL